MNSTGRGRLLALAIVPTKLRIFGVFVLTLVVGCATTSQTESLLAAAAFKTVPANTSERQEQLKQLPQDKLTKVVRAGKTYFVFPDKAHQVLYVGDEAQYQQYRMLCQQQQQLAKDGAAMGGAEPSNEAYWNGWGDTERAWGWE
jgi:hypothetical protein